jgi:hypothetical protein
MEGQLDERETIYGIGGIGLHWKVHKMERAGGPEPTMVVDQQDDISDDASYRVFESFVNHLYHTTQYSVSKAACSLL